MTYFRATTAGQPAGWAKRLINSSMFDMPVLGPFQDRRQRSDIHAGAGHPRGKNEGQSRPPFPRIAQVELIRKSGRLGTDDLVADQQPGHAGRLGGFRQRHELGANPVLLGEQDSRQGHGGVAVAVARQGVDPLDGLARKNPHGQRRPIAPDPPAGISLSPANF